MNQFDPIIEAFPPRKWNIGQNVKWRSGFDLENSSRDYNAESGFLLDFYDEE